RGLVPLLALAMLPACGLTRGMWHEQRIYPHAITGAVRTDDGALLADIETSGGVYRVSIPDPDAGSELDLADAQGPLPPGRGITLLPAGQVLSDGDPATFVDSGQWLSLGDSDRERWTLVLMVREGGSFHVDTLSFHRPVDWGFGSTYGSILMTPVTAAVDLFFMTPIEAVYMLFTLGQKGPLFDVD